MSPKTPTITKKQEPPDWVDEVRCLRAMAHPVRLTILESLCHRSHCVKDLNSLLPDLPQPVLSQHMRALREAGLVASHKDGPLRCYYILRPTLVVQIVDLLHRSHPERWRGKAAVQREARGDVPPTLVLPDEEQEGAW